MVAAFTCTGYCAGTQTASSPSRRDPTLNKPIAAKAGNRSKPARRKENSMSASQENDSSVPSFSEFLNSVRSASYRKFSATSESQVTNEIEFEQMKEHILDLYKRLEARRSFKQEDGAIFDCVVQKQSTSSNRANLAPQPPDLPTGQSASGPDHETIKLVSPLPEHQKDNSGSSTCPEGSYPMRRLTLEDITRFETLRDFLGRTAVRKQAPPTPRPRS
jgi:hypothetical protein